MGIVARQGIKSTISSYIGIGVAYLSFALVFPYCLSLEEYGLVRVMLDAASILALIFQLGLPASITRFFPRFKNREQKAYFVRFNLLMALLSCGIMIGAALLFKNLIIGYFQKNSPLFVQYFYYTLPLACALILVGICFALSANFMRLNVPTFLREVFIRVLVMCCAIFYFLNYYDLQGLIKAIVFAYLIYALFQLIYLFKIGVPPTIKAKYNKRKEFFRAFLPYYGFFSLNLIGAGVAVRIDVFMLTAIKGLETTAIYALGMYLATIVEFPMRSLSQIVNPIISKTIDEKDNAKLINIYKKTIANQASAGVFIFLIIVLNAFAFYNIVPKGESFIMGLQVVLIIGLGKLLSTFLNVNNLIVYHSKYYKINFVAVLVLLVSNIVGNYYLIPIYVINGAAISTVFSMSLVYIIMQIVVKLKYNLHPINRSTILLLAIGSITFFMVYFIPHLANPYYDIILRTLLIVILFVPAMYFLKISSEANNLIDRLIKFIKK